MRILITGAHFTPAQAVIEELLKCKDVEITYIGRNRTLEGDRVLSVESQVLSKLGVKFQNLIAGRLQRNFTIYTIPSLLKIPIGFIQAFYFLLVDKPDVILSFGGYVALPVVICGWLLSVPVIVHEQTLVVGLANKISNLFAEKKAVSFLDRFQEKNSKLILTGNPLRKEILETSDHVSSKVRDFINKQTKSTLPLILITGGNQGSHIINLNILEIIDDLTRNSFVIHQTGDSKYQDFEKLNLLRESIEYKERYLVRKWIDVSDFSYLLRKVDLSLSRAGANTLYELAYFGVPVVVIPIPYLYQDEQTKNARYFERQGLAEVLLQKNLTPKKLLMQLKENLNNLAKRKKDAKRARALVIVDGAKRLALEVLLLGEVNAKATKI